MKKIVLLSLFALCLPLLVMAQSNNDDLYFVPSKEKKQEAKKTPVKKEPEKKVVTTNIYTSPGTTVVVQDRKGNKRDMRDVDEYNRRYDAKDNEFAMEDDTLYVKEKAVSDPDGEWVNGFNGSQDDYEYAERIIRFRNPRFAVSISSPLYWDIVYGNICGDTEIELEIGAVKYTPDVIVIDCCKLGYKKLLHFREILHEDDIHPIIYNIYTYDDTETIRILLDYDDILHILMPYDAKNVCHYMLDKLKRIPVDPDILRQNISKEIHRIITSTGINRKHSGYDHIYYMIFLIIFKYNGNKVQIGELYKDIEKQYGKNTAAIERSTRSAIVSGWEKMKPVDKQMLFESCLANGTKPTNAMYINTIALYIKHLYNDQLEMYYKNKNDHT